MTTIGIDISKGWFDCFCLPNNQHAKFSNDPDGWQQFYQWLDVDPYVVMEASGPYYLGLATHLYNQGITVSVVNPLVIRRYGQIKLSRTKTDAKDATVIAQYGIDQQVSSLTSTPSFGATNEPARRATATAVGTKWSR